MKKAILIPTSDNSHTLITLPLANNNVPRITYIEHSRVYPPPPQVLSISPSPQICSIFSLPLQKFTNP